MRRWRLLAVTLGASSMGLLAQPPANVRFRVSSDTVIAGVSCAPTGRASASLHANGTLVECPVPRDTVIAGHLLPAGTWPRFTNARMLEGAWLPHDHTLQGLTCKGTGYKGWSVRFHADGSLALCYLAHAQVIDGVPCHGAAFLRELTGSTYVALHANGRLRSCRLSRSITLDSVRISKGQRIERPERSQP
jgi:hypothetical protein